ncbi:MAG: hypothetical protein Q8Q62_07375, partial [Mesorhizobium sp.]|nr:hypothetical protein [Mesorhizobium sp.]
MADFVAVLKKTIEGLGETTPDMRERVYAKARATIASKLAAITPAPPPAVIERQKRALEEAISITEAEYLAAESAAAAGSDDLESIMESLASPTKAPAAPAASAQLRPVPAPPSRAAGATLPPSGAAPAPRRDIAGPETASADRAAPAPLRGMTPPKTPARSRNGGRIAVALIALMFAGAAGYAVWLNKDEVLAMLGSGEGPAPAPADVAPQQPAPAPAVAAAEPEAPAEPKFTQRLNADGSEIDDGPANGVASIGEGTSVAAVTVPPPAPAAPAPSTAPAVPSATPAVPPVAPAATAEAPAAAAAQPAIAVGQRAIFYEERTNASQGSA